MNTVKMRAKEHYPAVWQVNKAEDIFLASYRHFTEHESKKLAIKLALSYVWMAGRIYQTAKTRTDSSAECLEVFARICEEEGVFV